MDWSKILSDADWYSDLAKMIFSLTLKYQTKITDLKRIICKAVLEVLILGKWKLAVHENSKPDGVDVCVFF